MHEAYERILGRATYRRLTMERAKVPDALDVQAIRLATRRYGETQESFAAAIGVPLKTLKNWEQRRRTPTGPARVLLAMIQKNPRIVLETIGKVRNSMICAAPPKWGLRT